MNSDEHIKAAEKVLEEANNTELSPEAVRTAVELSIAHTLLAIIKFSKEEYE